MKHVKKQVHIPQGLLIKKKKDMLAIKNKKTVVFVRIPDFMGVAKKNEFLFFSCNVSHEFLLNSFFFSFSNLLIGLARPFKKRLIFKGIGYKAAKNKKTLELKLGHSHPIIYKIIETVPCEIYKSTIIELESSFKDMLGSEAKKLKQLKLPDIYKGKGILYKGEKIVLKIGKKV